MQIVKRKKVVYVITKSNMGGAQRYVFDLATSIPADRFEAVVALGGAGPLKDKLEKAGIRVVSIDALQRDVSLVQELRALASIYKIIRHEKPAVLHLNSPKAGGLGGLAGRLLGVPTIVFTGHGWGFNEERPALQKMLIRIAQWLILFLAHKTIAVSNKTSADVESFVFVNKKIVIIHNGTQEFALLPKLDARNKLAEHLPLDTKMYLAGNDIFLIGIIAELHKNKGIDLAIRALSPLLHARPFIVLAVLGEGEERIRLEAQIEKEKLRGSVFLLGAVENAREYLLAFDLLLMPSRTEALPYALLEMGHAGRAVVASDVGGISEVIVNRASGMLVQPYDVQTWFDAVTFMVESPEERKSFGEGLKSKVRTEFSFNEMLKKTYDLY